MHDPTKVLLGAGTTNCKDVTEHSGNPSTFKAGLAVRQGDSALTLLKASGGWLGISLGKGLSDAANSVGIARAGLGIPVLIEATPARLEITITNVSNLTESTEDTLQIEHEGLLLDHTITFVASSPSEGEVEASGSVGNTATNLAAYINSELGDDFKAVAVGAKVTVTAKNNSLEGADFDVTYTANTSVGLTLDDTNFTGGGETAADYVSKGSKVYFSDTTGKADDPNSGATISDAIYVSGVLTGIQEDGTEVACALVDMPGGL